MASLLPRARFALRGLSLPWQGIGVAAAVGLGLALAAWVSVAIYERIPHNEDELAFVFQAKVFARGALAAPTPPVPEAFFGPFLIDLNGFRFAKYPPGYPLLLAPAAAFDLQWLTNPLLSAAALGLVALLGARWFGPRVGLFAALLGALSPFFLEYAGSLMSHASTLFVALLGIWCYARAWTSRSARYALASGACFGLAFLERPATALGVAAPFALHALWLSCHGRWRSLGLPLLMGSAPLVAGLPLYTYALSGRFALSMYELWWPFDRYGFGEGIGTLGRHTPDMGLWYVKLNLLKLAPLVLGWPLPGLLPFAPFVLEGLACLWRLRPGQPRPPALVLEALLFLSAVSLVLAYVPYWAPDPRYYYEALGAFLLVTALALGRVASFAARVPGGDWLAASLLAAVVLSGATSALPNHLWSLHGKNGFTRARLDAVERAGLRNALVLVVQEGDWSDYGSVFPANSPWLDGNVVYALHTTPENWARLRAEFRDRSAFELRGADLRPLP